MKNISRIFVSTVMALSVAVTASSQTFETSFFLDNYSYSYRINPAMQSKTNVIGFVLSNLCLDTGSNVSLGNFFFPRDGELVNCFNSAVSQSEFLSGLPKISSASEDFSMNILTVGFWNGRKTSFHTIEINTREFASAAVPYDIFAFLKKGGTDVYDMSGTSIDARGYVDIVYGYSREINDRIKVGGRIHGLVGAIGLEAGAQSLSLQTSQSSISVQGTGIIRVAQPAASVNLDKDGYYNLDRVMMNSTPGIAGFGAAVDLGVTLEAYEGLEASLAVTDLGGISWKYNVHGKTDATMNATSVSEMESTADYFFEEISRFRPGPSSRNFEMLPFNINAGARYKMPFYSGLSAGLFANYRSYKGLQYLNARLGATISPADWFSFTANYGYGTLGSSAGAAMSITGGSLNLYVGAETFLGRLSSDRRFPIDKFEIALNFGITFRFGGKA